MIATIHLKKIPWQVFQTEGRKVSLQLIPEYSGNVQVFRTQMAVNIVKSNGTHN